MSKSKHLQPATLLTHTGRKGKHSYGPVNPPIVRASTMLFPDVAALKAAYGTRGSYGRHGNETTLALEQVLCAAEGAAECMLLPSGLAAITTCLLALVRPGDHLLMVDSVYDPTRHFCDGLLKQIGVSTTYYDPAIGAGIASLIQENTKLVFVESPGSLTFEVQDIPAIAAAAHARGAVVVSDSTWATPIGWKSFELGIDISIHAATKYIVGHSDALMGVILTNEKTSKQVRDTYRQLGLTISGDDATLALRGMRTLAARLAVHRESSLKVAQWLSQQEEVAEVLYPPMPGAAGHEIWQRDFLPKYACGLMGVKFKAGVCEEQVATIVDKTDLFGIGFSWGGYESLILPTKPAQTRVVTANQCQGSSMRLHIGLEDVDDLLADLAQAFAAMRQQAEVIKARQQIKAVG